MAFNNTTYIWVISGSTDRTELSHNQRCYNWFGVQNNILKTHQKRHQFENLLERRKKYFQSHKSYTTPFTPPNTTSEIDLSLFWELGVRLLSFLSGHVRYKCVPLTTLTIHRKLEWHCQLASPSNDNHRFSNDNTNTKTTQICLFLVSAVQIYYETSTSAPVFWGLHWFDNQKSSLAIPRRQIVFFSFFSKGNVIFLWEVIQQGHTNRRSEAAVFCFSGLWSKKMI